MNLPTLPFLILQVDYYVSLLLPMACLWCTLIWWKRYRTPALRFMLIFSAVAAATAFLGGILNMLLSVPSISEYVWMKIPQLHSDRLIKIINLVADGRYIFWLLNSMAFLVFCSQLSKPQRSKIAS